MDKKQRNALRAATLIHEQLAGRLPALAPIPLPGCSWMEVGRLRRQIALAASRGWHAAAQQRHADLAAALRRLRMEVETAMATVETRSARAVLPTAADIYRDIVALQREFGEVKIDFAGRELSVTTDPIVLEDIDLGRFDIRLNWLDWQRSGGSFSYRIVARDPNPAGSDEEVIHPHVRDETLCEGQGRAAIRAALSHGRLYDLFVLVSQVLHTYARGSAYVELTDWGGITCVDCGTRMSECDSYSCQRCGSNLCDDCRQLCAGCEESHCGECLSQCPGCEMDFCRGCMDTCATCDRKFCGQCLEGGLCPGCRENLSQRDKENNHECAK